jgi:hypothetical protein
VKAKSGRYYKNKWEDLEMNNVTTEQIQQARAVDLLDFVRSYERDNIHLVGREYRLRDHDSLTVSNGKFHWHSRNVGGTNAIDYLTRVRGLGFVEAVQTIVGDRIPTYPAMPEQKPPIFSLPARNSDNNRVINYLRGRGIAMPIIEDCIRRGLLYEDTRRNCVFVGFDGSGVPRYAALRGTYGDFKGEAPGSDKRYSFLLPQVKPCNTAAVFESATDALAHATLHPDWGGCRLSLGGVSLAALFQFLTNHGEVRYLDVCTDNDEAGDACAEQIAGLSKRIKAIRSKPPMGKDWADCLK